jgi:maltose alpha-D-glucosyltransferase/alpha-amylase
MLIVKDDIFITGFGGAPHQTLAERRRKAPAARDIASLVRSIDSSVVAALERAREVAPDEQGKLAMALALWGEHSTTALVSGYRNNLANRLWPADPAAADSMLKFFVLERAVYELDYELAHRPERLRAPLAAALRILSDPTDEAA